MEFGTFLQKSSKRAKILQKSSKRAKFRPLRLRSGLFWDHFWADFWGHFWAHIWGHFWERFLVEKIDQKPVFRWRKWRQGRVPGKRRNAPQNTENYSILQYFGAPARYWPGLGSAPKAGFVFRRSEKQTSKKTSKKTQKKT